MAKPLINDVVKPVANDDDVIVPAPNVILFNTTPLKVLDNTTVVASPTGVAALSVAVIK